MEKIINKLINEFTKGVDTYTHNGSTWLIFTDKKEWVIELTDAKTLWYNYNFFKGMFDYVSMDVVENQHYITKWVEDNIVGGVGQTQRCSQVSDRLLDVTIQNGVKHTEKSLQIDGSCVIEDTIQNGVKKTQNIKEDYTNLYHEKEVRNVIQNGVRHTLNTEYMPTSMVEDIIENGVKETRLELNITEGEVEEIIEYGIKQTKTPGNGDIRSTIEWMEENKYDSYTKMIDDVIDYGIKEVRPLPEQSGELRGYGDYYKLKEDRTKAFIDYLEDTIKFGVKN